MKKGLACILTLLFMATVRAQGSDDKVETLDSVFIYSPFNARSSIGFTVVKLQDSLISGMFTLQDAGRKNLHLYCKEYGGGMLSSVSVRGAYASHTGVYWNEIPLNSPLNGQTDFNGISPGVFEELIFRKGGGSVELGSGAMSGALDLKNRLIYNRKMNIRTHLHTGSYESYGLTANISGGNSTLAGETGWQYYRSENDYPFPGTGQYNTNGQIRNLTASAGMGYRISGKAEIYTFGLLAGTERNLSAPVHTVSRQHLAYRNQAVTAGWKQKSGKIRSHFRTALLRESYTYIYDTKYPDIYDRNTSKKFLVREEISVPLRSNARIITTGGYEWTTGSGDNIITVREKTFYLHAGWRQSLYGNAFSYQVHLRKEWNNRYRIPFIFSAAGQYQVSGIHVFKFNLSANFRRPTLNDLYWIGGGNPDLHPEKSYSAEGIYEISYRSVFHLSAAIFYTKTEDLIQWQPAGDGLWHPYNILNTHARGIELETDLAGEHRGISFRISPYYHYTESINDGDGKQLIYQPVHRGGCTTEIAYRKWRLAGDYTYSGEVFTTTSHTQYLPGYALFGLEIARSFWKNHVKISGKAENLTDKYYEIIPGRPMPGRHFNLTISTFF